MYSAYLPCRSVFLKGKFFNVPLMFQAPAAVPVTLQELTKYWLNDCCVSMLGRGP